MVTPPELGMNAAVVVASGTTTLVHHQRLPKVIALVLLATAALAILQATPGTAVRQVALPLGCNKEYIRQMLLSLCDRYRRSHRSPLSPNPPEGVKEQDGPVPDGKLADEGGRNPGEVQLRHRPLDAVSDGVLHDEVLAQAESEDDLQRFIRAEKSLLKCCFKGCSWKDFVGVC